jgi:hypothetical protein
MTNNKQQTEMNKEFVPYEVANELKQLGFDEPCLASYYRGGKKLDIAEYVRHGEYTVLAPLYQQAFRFFRKKFNCHRTIKIINEKYVGIAYYSVVNFSIDKFNTYEEAELNCLKKLIEIVNEQQ